MNTVYTVVGLTSLVFICREIKVRYRAKQRKSIVNIKYHLKNVD